MRGAAHSHRTVDRVAGILEAAAVQPDGVRLAEVADRLDAPRSSIHSLLKGLVAVGYLVEREGSYVIGPGLSALLAPRQERSIVDVARADVADLSERVEETVLLGTRVGESIVYVYQVECRHSIRYSAQLGQRRPLYPPSIGKLFLSDMDQRRLDAFLRHHREFDPDAVRAELAEIRETGVAYNREETVKGVMAAAAAIRKADGRVVAAISATGPAYRMTDRLTKIGEEVLQTAGRISKAVSANPRLWA
ncbi:MAG: helix-turn-helix domain-containing protein [Streptosporangiales bacterium]|nr:helix-turn-helix domain-containing protein [Streptosporangiales bacterium]